MTPTELTERIRDAETFATAEDAGEHDPGWYAEAVLELSRQLDEARAWNLRMRRICTAARKWAAQIPTSRRFHEAELLAAVADAVSKEDSRPLAVQIGDARRCLEFWTSVLAELDAKHWDAATAEAVEPK